ncbi:MAG: transferrin receptor-like dimerization domain-containing protein [Ferruginibacter sp.]
MTRILLVASACIMSVSLSAQSSAVAGFGNAAAEAELQTEKKFDSYLDAKNVDRYIKDLSAVPHHMSSPGGKANARYILDKFKSWGYDAQIETFYVLFPTPVTRLLEMTGSKYFKAALKEPALAADATSGQDGQLPVYNCWSPDGDVTAELVFVNYGVPDDYEMLARMGVDVKGKIVIAKYGHSWRGIKPKVAQEHGAVGCIIYSDPKEDGYFNGDVYPKGPYRPELGAQRGSVLDMPIYPGDPLTPGTGSTKDAKRIEQKDAENLLKIPVIPIGYADALPLLQSLEGAVVPEAWRGALPITYHAGPSKNKVHLKLSFDWQIKPIENIIAKLKGSELPDEWVIRGNHHDAWVNGAGDPVSGLAAMMEEARAVAEMVKTGWKPRRTIVYCAWDGEEPSLLGSTEWVETHADELKQKVVLYINSDGNGRGFLYASGSHALENAFTEITKEVKDPQTGISIFERKRSADIVSAGSAKTKKELLVKNTFTLEALGAGSDYSPFIQHLGIPSLNLGFGGEDDGGEYHSVYDSYDMYKRFKDPAFEYGVTLAKTAGRTTLRFANAAVLPFNFTSLQKIISGYTTEVMKLADDMRESTLVENEIINKKHYEYANKINEPLLSPASKSEVPFLSFASLQNAVVLLEKVTADLNAALNDNSIAAEKKAAVNQKLYTAEQQLLTQNGLPRRSWYRHSVYAPGFYTGYGVKTLPGVREAIEQRNWKEAQEQIELTAASIDQLSNWLTGIQADLKK